MTWLHLTCLMNLAIPDPYNTRHPGGGGGGGTPYIRMIWIVVVIFRGCNRRFSIF